MRNAKQKLLVFLTLSVIVLLCIAQFIPTSALAAATCQNNLTADVVALDQQLVFNRLGAANPIGMVYALREDIVEKVAGGGLVPGNVMIRSDKRPRPLTLRMNEGDCLTITFQNLLAPAPQLAGDGAAGGLEDQPATRSAGIIVQGMSLVVSIGDAGAFVGANPVNSLAPSGGTRTYQIHAEKEGIYIFHTQGDNVSGEGMQGTNAFGLFGVINVEPRGSEWYRSQVTRDEIMLGLNTTGTKSGPKSGRRGSGFTADGHPIINYDATFPADYPVVSLRNKPIFRILDGTHIVHNELYAIITGPNRGNFPAGTYGINPAYPSRNAPFREFTVMFHDETQTVQPFAIFTDPQFKFTLNGVKDAFMINYGSGGVGPEVVANRLGVGPMANCAECKYEEFFLTSWAVGDPAMVVDIPANYPNPAAPDPGLKATKALYPADPSNVFHSYINDRTKIRNAHVGKEHHIFHLHSHQWLFTPDDDNSMYLDAQGIGPGGTYTYEIAYNSGNRNKTPGDAIFHCHFYPHFAQGMWALWRNHDVFELGTQLDAYGFPVAGSRALPDGEIAVGTPIPAVVPIPSLAMAPMPGNVRIVNGQADFSVEPDTNNDGIPDRSPGYPFIIGGVAGHRPPTPPLDIADDGGLPRHVMVTDPSNAFTETHTTLDFDKVVTRITGKLLPEAGQPVELAGQAFHAVLNHPSFRPDGTAASFETNGLPPQPGAPFADPCRGDLGDPEDNHHRTYKAAVIQFDMKLNKAGYHFPQSRIVTLWGDVAATLAGTRPPEPFFIRANSNDCVEFHHTNLAPSVYEQDDFQVKTPTDVIGQHIHNVKFDVTSSDGSGNGFNYEDGTLSPGEVRERIAALNDPLAGGLLDANGIRVNPPATPLVAKSHPFFGAGPGNAWLGARTTIQRWFVDPLLNNEGVDRRINNVFTHDHFGPSTHQQAGLYGTFITEPEGSVWRDPETGVVYGGRFDGGPTSWKADIITLNTADSFREFMIQVSDFFLAYKAGACTTVPCSSPGNAINPPGQVEVPLPIVVQNPGICPNGTPPPCPEAISAADVGTYTVNYRNEPIAERVRDSSTNTQAAGLAGDLAFAFSSRVNRANPLLNAVGPYPPLTGDVQPGDPFTPLMRAYARDSVLLRIQAGAHEESHNASLNGLRWLFDTNDTNSGYVNTQHLGISEQFKFAVPVLPAVKQLTNSADYLYTANASTDGFWNGTWGLLRNYAKLQRDLLPLPNNPVSSQAFVAPNEKQFNGVCPNTAPVRTFDISAVAAQTALPGGTLVYNSRPGPNSDGPLTDPTAILYVRSADLDPLTGKLKAGVPIEPLILRANAGDCINVNLTNALPVVLLNDPGFDHLPNITNLFNANQIAPSTQVGLHPQLVEIDVTKADGNNVGQNPAGQTAPPGGKMKYTWYAGISTVDKSTGKRVATPVEYGAAGLMPADRIKQSGKGALGALIIEPQGSTWEDNYDRFLAGTLPAGERVTRDTAIVTPSAGAPFRDFVVVFQDDLNLKLGNNSAVPTVVGQEDAEDSGMKAINYRTEPHWLRKGFAPSVPPAVVRTVDFTDVLSNTITGGQDPQTPVFTATAGEPVRFHLVHPGGHTRNHTWALYGHTWEREPRIADSTKIGDNPHSFWRGSQDQIGPSGHWDVVPSFKDSAGITHNAAGGAFNVKGDYLYRDWTPNHFMNGMWGVFRVQ